MPPTADLAAIEVFRDLLSQKHNPDEYCRNLAQRSEWTRDRRVTVTYRPLKYYNPTEPPREKGVDILAAFRIFQAAAYREADVLILASHDTDLEPAVEAAMKLGTCHVETAGWHVTRF
ncbi:NYN domain-containing protein [Cutibacterium acnes]|nr:NYN domain-containing protein [Cutibacterium acnes]REB51970.1 NYN domain-containing protein [Cutibacterium acnes]REB54915.1 NYN domain-containing protein [Cutibacterium acnes]REB58548.1 NYN domain-containing protein [Cutibacterium acnes]REB59402.1 NYN domain-containing protein [Cutibacterium acnes]